MIKRELYNKIKSIVDGYRKSGVSAVDIKNHFSIKKNFKDLLSSLVNSEFDSEKNYSEMDFEKNVREILFDRILLDRIYYEKDNPITEKKENYKKSLTYIDEYSIFLKKIL